MHKNILNEAYHEILEDTKLVKLATITTICHSLIFVCYCFYQTYFVLTSIKWESMHLWNFQNYLKFLFWSTDYLYYFIWFIIIILIWYFLLPAIAEWSMIHYINSENKSWTSSLWKWFMNFFPMFEYNWLISFFNFFIFIVIISRIYVMDIIDNIFIQTILLIWFIFIVLISILLPYTKFLIVIEWKWVWESIKESIIISFNNMWTTIRFVLVNYLLYIRFLLNILIIIWIPLLIIYILIQFEVWQNNFVKTFIYSIIIFFIIISSYLNWIIEAFFISYWNKVYKMIK